MYTLPELRLMALIAMITAVLISHQWRSGPRGPGCVRTTLGGQAVYALAFTACCRLGPLWLRRHWQLSESLPNMVDVICASQSPIWRMKIHPTIPIEGIEYIYSVV